MSGHILIVDPDLTRRLKIKSALTQAFYEVSFAETGMEALRRIARTTVDVILLSQDIVDNDAYEICNKLKVNPRTTIIPILIIASEGQKPRKAAGFNAHADGLYAHPLNTDDLRMRLRCLIRQKRAIEDMRLRNAATSGYGFAEAAAVYTLSNRQDSTLSVFGLPADKLAAAQQVAKLASVSLVPETISDPDLFVVYHDNNNPDSSSEVISRLRRQTDTRETPILFACPPNDLLAIQSALELGATDYVGTDDAIYEAAGRIRALAGQVQYASTVQKNMQNQLRMAIHDPLTGLHNRRYAQQYLSQFFAQPTQKHVAVMMFDIDHFKTINDTYGHSAGDEILCQVARRLERGLRKMDLIARMGGEEFLVVIPAIAEDRAKLIANRMRVAISSKPFTLEGKVEKINITISAGVAWSRTSSVNQRNLIDCADKALYQSKDSGRNLVSCTSVAA